MTGDEMGPSGSGTAARVLVVEDDAAIAEVVTLQLELAGYVVGHAVDGDAALAAIEAERPDLVLLDVMMPGMDGWAVLQRLRRQPAGASLPVLMLTAKAMPADQVRSYNLGASGYLAKPFTPEALVGKVRRLLSDA